MVLAASEYGVFGPLVGIVSAIMAAGAAMTLLWAGPLEKWRPPDADLPGLAKRMIFLACSVLMVLLALEAKPANIDSLKRTVWWLLGSWVTVGIAYVAFRYALYHSMLNPDGNGRKPVLGGLWMTSAAKTAMREHGLTNIKDLIDGSPGPEAIWSAASRFWARVLIVALFIGFVVLATTSLLTVGLITYVKTTGKAFF